MVKLVDCNRCGARELSWVKSARTGRFYLALTQKYHGLPADMNGRATPGGVNVLKHRPHQCDVERPICETCGYRHDRGLEYMACAWRMDGGRVVEDGHELLYRGESPKVAHDPELPTRLVEDHKKGARR